MLILVPAMAQLLTPTISNTNKNGQLLIDHLQESNMMVGNTKFRKKHSKLWTFISDMSGSKTQVDYILINRKWKNSFKNCEAYNTQDCHRQAETESESSA